jgi:hypothetical protein
MRPNGRERAAKSRQQKSTAKEGTSARPAFTPKSFRPAFGNQTTATQPWIRATLSGSLVTVLIAVILLIALAVQVLIFINASSQTSDEAAHIAAGYSYLKTLDFRLNPEHPPLIKELCAIPLLFLKIRFPWGPFWDQADEWNVGRRFVHEQAELLQEETGQTGASVSNDQLLFWARMPVLLLSICLGWSIFQWGREMFGPWAGLLALALYVLDPNIVAHSGLVTTDLGVTLFIFLSVYALWKYVQRPGPSRALWTGLMVGGSLASKYSAVWLFPILGLLALFLIFSTTSLPERPWSIQSESASGIRRRMAALIFLLGMVILVALLLLVLVYFGKGLPALLVGLQGAAEHTEQGHAAFMVGEISDTGWWYYFLFAFLIKTPLGTLVLLGMTLWLLASGALAGTMDRGHRRLCFLGVPIIAVLIFSAAWTVNIGLRHILPIFPFLFILVGSLAEWWASRRKRFIPGGVLILVCLLWNSREAVQILPDHLAYFNQLAGGPKNGFRYLSDSNIDWGQSAKQLRAYVQRQGLPAIYGAFSTNSDPWYYGLKYQYVPGTGNLKDALARGFLVPPGISRELFAVSAMVLQSVGFVKHDAYDWLKSRTPIAQVGYSILIYDITGDEMAHLRIAYNCHGFQVDSLAVHEAQRVLQINPKNADALQLLQRLGY